LSTLPLKGDSDFLASDLATAKKQALYYLKFRSRSSAEMRRYLDGKGHAIRIQDEVMAWLQELGYVDDLRFCQQWIENRCRTNPMGALRLVQELRRKGIHQPIIDEAMTEFDQAVDEAVLAYELATNRVRQYHGEDVSAVRRKMAGFLQRRGFTARDVHHAVDRVLDENIET